MWHNWLEPIECTAAREALDRDDPAQAARCVLDSPRLRHRACQELLAKIQPRLIELGERLLDADDLGAAADLLRLAEQCGTPPQRLRRLIAQCELRRKEQQAEKDWRAGRIHEARRLADQGRLVSAADWAESIDGDPQLSFARRDWRKKAARMDEYVQQAEAHLEAGRRTAAAACVRKARELAASDPRVIDLVERIGDDGSDGFSNSIESNRTGTMVVVAAGDERLPQRPTVATVLPPKSAAHQSPGSSMKIPASFVMTCGQDQLLVLAQSEIVVGSVKGRDVDLPLLGRMHDRQCLLMRDGTDVRLLAYVAGLVTINGRSCEPGCAYTLADGDRIEFEHRRVQFDVRRLPSSVEEGDGTLLLEADPTCPLHIAGIGRVDVVLLLDNCLQIAPRPPAHWCVPELPGERLILRRDGGQLTVETHGNVAWWDDAEQPALSSTRSLYVEADRSEAGQLAALYQGQPIDECVFELRPIMFSNSSGDGHVQGKPT